MRIFAPQLNFIVGDLDGNTKKIILAIEQGRRKDAELILFSELAVTGYPPEDLLLQPNFLEQTNHCLNHIIDASKDVIVIIGTVRENRNGKEKHLYNSAAVIENGVLLGFQDKRLLPTYDIFDERRYFEPGEQTHKWMLKEKTVVITICEDIWQYSDTLRYTSYRQDPIADLQTERLDLLLNLSASPFSYDKKAKRETVCCDVARALHCPVILCNQVGANDSLIFDGYSLFVDANGTVLKEAKGFEEDALYVDLKETPVTSLKPDDALNDLFQALVMGTRDYFHKQGFVKACLGLSGGIDSALVACIAVEALGSDNVLGVLMPSRYSSEGSIIDAVHLVQNIGMPYKQIPIEEPLKAYLNLLQPIFDGRPSDTTEENLQARIRGMILMALSNKLGYIVLSTGNKSELALGYSTLYGDLCGGLAVIGDVTKTQVYALSRWINRNKEIIPLNTITKPPSAELKPDQKDSDSLPDYAIIDNVLKDYIEEHLTATQIATTHGYSLDLVQNLIKRIHLNEYKRRQSPPNLRISEKSFSVGRKYPIVQKFVS